MTTQELKQQIDKVLGNSIRCLLPSYWWKRAFGAVIDNTISRDEVKTINGESIVGEGNLKVGVTTVGSIDELNALEAEVGDIATVGEESTMLVSVGDLQQVDDPSEILEKWDNLTRIVKVEFGEPVTGNGYHATVYLNEKNLFTRDTILITSSEGGFLCVYGVAGEMKEITIEEVNKRLKKHDYRFIMGVNVDAIDSTFKLHAYSASADAYIKGDSWERLAKESDLRGIVGESEGMEIREFHIGESLTDVQKAWNLETRDLAVQNKCLTVYKIQTTDTALPQGTVLTQTNYLPGTNESIFNYARPTVVGSCLCVVVVDSSGNTIDNITTFEPDAEVSATSTNAVQNKVITAALNNKVDKVEGKQLSTEDFTTALKTKLEGLNSFDPTEINNKVDGLQTQLNTLVSGDASTAIESFNEITAFLNGIEDSESLDSIIASIEQQIANKQDKIEDLDTIRSGASLGATALQEHQDISHLATKEEVTNLTNEMVANEEVHAAAYTDLDSRLKDIGSLISGVAVTKEEFQEGLQSITDEIIANEEVTAAALNDLNSRIKEIITRLNNAGL